MTTRKGSGAVRVWNDARLAEILIDGRDTSQVSLHTHKTQFKNTRADFAAQIARDLGPRLAQPGWVRFTVGGAK